MRRIYILIIFLSAFLYACKKDESSNSGEIKILVMEYGSNHTIKDAAVGLLKRTPGSGIGSSSYEVIKTGFTDSNGFISFGNYNDWSNLYIDVQHPDYYDISTISYDQVKNQQSKIVLNGVAYLGINFISDKNKPPYRAIRSYPYKINYADSESKYYPTIAYEFHRFSFAVFSDWENEGDPRYLLYDSAIYLQSPKLQDTAYYTIIY
jgi:hypothetical protein